MAIADRFIVLDWLRFHDQAAPPVVLLHALGAGSADWDSFPETDGDRRVG